MSGPTPSVPEQVEFVAQHIMNALMLVDFSADGIDEVIECLVDRLVAEEQLQPERRDEALRLVQEREGESSTALGQGLAVPHARIPDFTGSRVAFSRLQKPLDLGAPDDRPVRFVVLLLTGDDHELHLVFLMSIARMMSDGAFAADAHAAADESALRQAVLQYFRRSRAP